MQNSIIQSFEDKVYSEISALPSFRPGDTVKVDFEIVEVGDKGKGKSKGKDQDKDKKRSRIQSFQGVVIRYKKGKVDGSFTVRKMGANGVGVERVFPVCTPKIMSLTVIASGIVRRSRLFYLRERSGKSARIRSRHSVKPKTEMA